MLFLCATNLVAQDNLSFERVIKTDKAVFKL